NQAGAVVGRLISSLAAVATSFTARSLNLCVTKNLTPTTLFPIATQTRHSVARPMEKLNPLRSATTNLAAPLLAPFMYRGLARVGPPSRNLLGPTSSSQKSNGRIGVIRHSAAAFPISI